MSPELAELIDAYLAGELDEAGVKRLEALLKQDPQAAQQLRTQAGIDQALGVLLGQPAADRAVCESVMAALLSKSSRVIRHNAMSEIAGIKGLKPVVTKARGRARVRSTKQSWWLAAAAALVGALLLWHFNASAPASSGPLAEIVQISGRAELVASGRSVPVTPAMKVQAGERLITGGDGRLQLRFSDGSLLILASGSALSAPRVGGAAAVEVVLDLGEVQAEVAPQPEGHSFAVSTPHARAEVVGTRFTLHADAGRTRLEVNEGAVRLAKKDGTVPAILVKAGFRAVAAPGTALVATPLAAAQAVGVGKGPVVWCDSFDELGSWLITSWRRPGGIVFEPSRTVFRSAPAALRLRYVYPRLPAAPEDGMDVWLANQRSVERQIAIPAGATHLRLWIKVLASGPEARLYVALYPQERKKSWSLSADLKALPGDWHLLEANLQRMPEYWDTRQGTLTGKDVSPLPIAEIQNLEFGLNLGDAELLIDDVEFVRVE